MIIDNFLLPRFLILELVFACHYLQFTRACTVLCGATEEPKDTSGEEGAVEQLDATERKHNIVLKKGVVGLKKILEEKVEGERIDAECKGIKGLRKALKNKTMCFNDTFERKKVQSQMEPYASSGILGLKSILKSSLSCNVSLNDLNWRYPPLMYDMSGFPVLPLPSSLKNMVIRLQKGEVLTLSCPGGNVSGTITDTVQIKCEQQDKFMLNNTLVDIEQFGCSRNPRETEVFSTKSGGCGPEKSGKVTSLGFQLKGTVTPVVTVCHSKKGEVTYYTNHTVLGHLFNSRRLVKYRPNFKEGKVYFQGVSANSAYKLSRQRRLFKSLFGSESTRFFQVSEGLYLARGHLTPSGDLLYRNWQEVTYMYSNVVPQWQVVNNGNWKDVEDAVRSWAKLRKSSLHVFTGTKGILKLRGKELWLVNNTIPVPEYLWKLVVDPLSSDSIVFVTLNNPHLVYLTRSVTLCKDICERAGWAELLQEREVIKHGYTQCCDPKEFTKQVPWLPDKAGGNVLVF